MGNSDSSSRELIFKEELKGHNKNVSMITLHKGKLYSASHDLTIRQWESESGVCMHIFRGHNKYITAMVMSRDGIIFSGSDDGEIRSWAAERQAELNIYKGHTKTITSLTLADDQLYSGSFDNDIRQWDTKRTECVRVYRGHDDIVTGIVIRGEFLFSSSADTTVRKWSTIDGTCLLTMSGHGGWVWDIVIIASGYHVYSSSVDGTIRKWNAMTGKCIKVFDEAKDCVSRITLISHEGSDRLVASSWDGSIRQYNLNTDTLINTLSGHAAKIKSIMAINSRILISGADDHELRIWNLKNGSCLYKLKIDKPITSMCMGENNHILYCANKSGTIRKYMIPRTAKSEQYLANVTSQEEQTHYSTYETSLV